MIATPDFVLWMGCPCLVGFRPSLGRGTLGRHPWHPCKGLGFSSPFPGGAGPERLRFGVLVWVVIVHVFLACNFSVASFYRTFLGYQSSGLLDPVEGPWKALLILIVLSLSCWWRPMDSLPKCPTPHATCLSLPYCLSLHCSWVQMVRDIQVYLCHEFQVTCSKH